ncbi:TonB-dependent receptor family protein [Flavobacterium sp. F-65]|uniref:TonB-dependent receptor family protein n=1 Tax=Flavobacterium pisciphilum TaxID=2893755 RepID=A0ABS8MSB4_9FLAO|nr:outer membrane beta-barrel family protein [Flavobacterium sp. F-65]MCC9071643.1 TonB-dependent receptor family protein [Flavobacterium sp. F-65]
MKLKIIMLLLIGVITSVQAQNSGSISGKVLEKTTNSPISYATIAVKGEGKTIASGVTDDKGDFTLKNIPLKNYILEIQYIGFKSYKANLFFSESKKEYTFKVALEEEATQLKGVNIVSERSTIEQKIDRKVITVGKDLTTAGASASDIMNNIPSVNVDQDGKLSLRGNSNVRVLIDGRPSNIDPAQLLKQIPSTSIKKIELITNPSAKYNPEGMSGIINIVLHKNANNGFNGNFNAGITFGETAKYNNSLDLNYKVGKVNFFGTAGRNFGLYANDGLINRLDTPLTQNIDVKSDNDSHLYKIGMDYYINDNNTISVYTNQNAFDGFTKINTDINYGIDTKNIYEKSKYDSENTNNTYNIAYKHLFKKEGHTLDVEGNYNDFKQPQTTYFDRKATDNTGNSTTSIYNDYIKDVRKNSTLNIDYVNPLDKKTTLEAGAEARITRTTNDYATENPLIAPTERLSNYTYDIDIYSAYVTFGQKFKKFSYQLGARFESYKVEANLNHGQSTFKDDYITLYPSAYFTYNLNDNNTFQFSYSRRVDRPSLEQTKPIREFSTPLVTSLGNPELRPQFTNSVEINYTKIFGKSTFTAGVYVRSINDQISRTLKPDDSDPTNQKQIMSYANFDRNTAYGFEMSANYKATKWLDVQPSIDFSSIKQRGIIFITDPITNIPTTENKEISANSFNARLNANFKANKRLSFLLFGFYRGAVDGIQNNSHDMYKMDAGTRYTLLDNKMTLSLRFNDIFDTMKYAFDSTNPYPQTGKFTWESQTVYFGLSYNFGGGKNKSLQRKQREDNTNKGGGGMF